MSSSNVLSEVALSPWRPDALDCRFDTEPYCPRCGETLGFDANDLEVGMAICADCSASDDFIGARNVAS